MEKVLVAYASKYGATAEIAERIGQVLREAGVTTEVLPAGKVRDLTTYRAVVLGSAAYIFHWRKAATRLLKALAALAPRPVGRYRCFPRRSQAAQGIAAGCRRHRSARRRHLQWRARPDEDEPGRAVDDATHENPVRRLP